MFWILAMAFVIGFAMAFSIGANDVANSMAPSVGAKALTLKQAVLIAGVLEFAGAYVFGRSVVETIRKGIVNIDLITDPNVLLAGAFAALIASVIFVVISTAFSMPVSTSHAIVGAMAGFGVVAVGAHAVCWVRLFWISIAWVLSPVLGALLAFGFFKLFVWTVLHNDRPANAVVIAGPISAGVTVLVLGVMFCMEVLHCRDLTVPLLLSVPLAAITGLLTWHVIRRRWRRAFGAGAEDAGAEKHFSFVEGVYRRLQLGTACYVSLAHGSNDVANAIGPIAAIYVVAQTGLVSGNVEFPRWLLAFGGVGIALGAWIWGHRVMQTIGHNITEITNTRGFTISFSTATTVLLASVLGMPVSTTHTVVGAVVGVGFARGLEAVNLSVVRQIVLSWFLTVPAAAATSAIVYLVIRPYFH